MIEAGTTKIHAILTRTTYIGEHRFNTRSHKDREKKPEAEVSIMAVPALIERSMFDAVQGRLKSRSPMVTPARVTSGPTLLTGICFCDKCGGAMTLRTGKGSSGGMYRYYTCSTKARQGETGCKGRSIPMDKLDHLVASHLEDRLLQPERLGSILSGLLDRRQERSERRREHLAELNRKITETDQRLNRLYDAIESGVADLDDAGLKDRIAKLKTLRDQATADADRTRATLDNSGSHAITPDMIETLASAAREKMRVEGGGYRRDHLRAFAQHVEVADNEVRIMGSKSELLHALVAASSVETAGNGVRSSVLKWRASTEKRRTRSSRLWRIGTPACRSRRLISEGPSHEARRSRTSYHAPTGIRGRCRVTEANGQAIPTKAVRARFGDGAMLRPVAEARAQMVARLGEKLTGFADEATREFEEAAAGLEAKRRTMVVSQRSERRNLAEAQACRTVEEVRERNQRLRKGLLGIWDRVVGRHAKLRRQNEIEADASARRDAAERQTLIDRQLASRRELRDELRSTRSAHQNEMTWLKRDIAETSLTAQTDIPAETGPVREQLSKRRRRSGPSL